MLLPQKLLSNSFGSITSSQDLTFINQLQLPYYVTTMVPSIYPPIPPSTPNSNTLTPSTNSFKSVSLTVSFTCIKYHQKTTLPMYSPRHFPMALSPVFTCIWDSRTPCKEESHFRRSSFFHIFGSENHSICIWILIHIFLLLDLLDYASRRCIGAYHWHT